MTAIADAVSDVVTGDPTRQAAGFAVAVLCLLLAVRVSDVLASGQPGQVPFTVALFVLPLACAVPAGRKLVVNYRWAALTVQAVATWVPFAVFGGRWQVGIGGLLAGMVLLTFAGRASWLVAGALLAADTAVRVAVTGLPSADVAAGGAAVGLPFGRVWFGVLTVAAFYVDDALIFFGIVRLAQVVGEVDHARGQAAGLAVVAERLRTAAELRAAVGRRLDDIAAGAREARRTLPGDPAAARAEVAAVGATAREAVTQARKVTAGERRAREESGAPGLPDAVIGARLARAILAAVLTGFAAANGGYIVHVHSRYGGRLLVLALADIALTMALQLYHSGGARRGRRPRAWAVTLAVQAVLVYAFAFPFIWAYVGALGAFLAGSVLLLFPSRWRWAGYAAVVASYSLLYAVLPVRASDATGHLQISVALLVAAETAEVGLMVYGLSRLAGLAAELARLRGQLARMAAVTERLRIGRDVHDLLGLGLSAIALKSDLIEQLIGRDDTRAAAEMGELTRICAAARVDARLTAAGEQQLSLAGDLADALQILGPAGIDVRASLPAGPLPGMADEVLAPVLREALTNILRHSSARACVIEVTTENEMLRLRVSNDGVSRTPGTAAGGAAVEGGGGRGLANLTARVRAAGGQLTSGQTGDRFDLVAEIPYRLAEIRCPAGRTGSAPVGIQDERTVPGVLAEKV